MQTASSPAPTALTIARPRRLFPRKSGPRASRYSFERFVARALRHQRSLRACQSYDRERLLAKNPHRTLFDSWREAEIRRRFPALCVNPRVAAVALAVAAVRRALPRSRRAA